MSETTNQRRGMLVIISGPSGSGKGTVVKQLDRPDFALSISMTTRDPRPGEQHGRDYFYTSREEFIRARENGEFLEHAEFVGNMYGTPRAYVEEQVAAGKAVILEIDVVGALQIKEKFEDSISVFLIPPTFEELAQRLKNRKTEDEETIRRRIKRANSEIEYINAYDYLVVNTEVDQAVADLKNIIDSEYLKPHRNQRFIEAIKGENYDVNTLILGTDDQG